MTRQAMLVLALGLLAAACCAGKQDDLPPLKLDPVLRRALLRALTQLELEAQKKSGDPAAQPTTDEGPVDVEQEANIKRDLEELLGNYENAFQQQDKEVEPAAGVSVLDYKPEEEEQSAVFFRDETTTTTTTTTTPVPAPQQQIDIQSNLIPSDRPQAAAAAADSNALATDKKPVEDQEVSIFQAPLVAAFTLQQDEKGNPKSVVPLLRRPLTGLVTDRQQQRLQQAFSGVPHRFQAPPTTKLHQVQFQQQPRQQFQTLQQSQQQLQPQQQFQTQQQLQPQQQLQSQQSQQQLQPQQQFQTQQSQQQLQPQQQFQSQQQLQPQQQFQTQQSQQQLQPQQQFQTQQSQQQFRSQQQLQPQEQQFQPPQPQSQPFQPSQQAQPFQQQPFQHQFSQQRPQLTREQDLERKIRILEQQLQNLQQQQQFQQQQQQTQFLQQQLLKHQQLLEQEQLRLRQQQLFQEEQQRLRFQQQAFLDPPPPPPPARAQRQEQGTAIVDFQQSVGLQFQQPQRDVNSQLQNLLFQSGVAGDLATPQEDLNIVSKILSLNHEGRGSRASRDTPERTALSPPSRFISPPLP